MRRWLSRILRWGLLGVLCLLVLAVLAVELLSWNFLKAPIEERFEAATGRSLSIEGELSLSLFPRPVATVNRLALDNPEWAEAPNMLEVERIRVWPSLGAALTGKLVLDKVTVDAPTGNVEVRADGTTNWVFPGLEAPVREDHAEDGALPIVRRLSLADARIRYRAVDREPMALSIPSLQVDDDGESTAVQASMSFREKDFDLEAKTDSLRKLAGNGGAFDGELSVQAEQGRIGATFTLPQAPALQPARIDWELELQSLAGWSRWAGQPVIDLQALSLGSQLEYETGRWDFTDIETTLAGSRVTGQLAVDTGGPAPVFSANLHSPEFDAAALLAALPASGERVDGLAAAIPVLPDLAAGIELSIDNLLWKPHHVRGLTADLDLADQVLTVDTLEFDAAGGSAVASAELASNRETLAMSLDANVTDLDLALLEAWPGQAGIVTGALAFDLERLARQPPPGIEEVLEQLRIETAVATYTNDAGQVDFRAALETVGAPEAPRISVTGDFRNRPIEATLSGDPLTGLAAAPEDYALAASARSGAATIQLETDLASVLQPQTLAAKFELTADSVDDLQPWLQRPMPSVPGLRVAGRLARDAGQWDVTGLEVEAGKSSITGEVHLNNAERPFVEARLHADHIDPLAWAVDAEPSDEHAGRPDRDSGAEAEAGNSMPASLRSVDARLDLRVDQLDLPADFAMQQVVVSAALEQGRVEIDPLRFDIAEGQVAAKLDLETSDQQAFGHLETQFDGIVLDRLVETFAPLEGRLGRLSGTVNLDIAETRSENLRNDLMFPFIGRVGFQESKLRFEDTDAKTDLTLTMQTRDLDEGRQELHVDGHGQYDGDPFALDFRGDELLRVRNPERPYALELKGEIVQTRFGLSGTVSRPLKLEGVDGELSLSGPNPQRLERILGIPFPLLPAYSVSGDLSLDDKHWVLQNLDGQVGGSDLSGRLGIDVGVQPPHLSGRLQSETVRMQDLAGIFGAEPGQDGPESGEPASAGRLVLPQQPLIEDAWRKVSADVRYRGNALRAGDLPLSNVVINFVLEDGRMQFAPLGFGIGDGSIDFNLDLNVTERPSHGTMEATVRGVDLQEALSTWGLAGDSLGRIGARGKFWVEGVSIAEIFGSADGGLLMLMQGGRLDAMLVELAGLDALQVLTSFLLERGPIPIDCAYVDVKTRDGLATLDTFVIDTDDTNFTGGGEIDFADERLDITVLANPKDLSVGVARAPLQISGTFNDIGVGIGTGAVAARLGAAAVLGVLATPIAGLLPLLDTGAGEDSGYCQGLVRRSHEAIKDREDPQ
ncbi:MAG: AsmA family protein [Pseudomonadota bacterium]